MKLRPGKLYSFSSEVAGAAVSLEDKLAPLHRSQASGGTTGGLILDIKEDTNEFQRVVPPQDALFKDRSKVLYFISNAS